MNGLLQAATQTAPQLAGLGGVVWLLVFLFRAYSTSTDRHDKELTRVRERFTTEINRLQAALDAERERNSALDAALDAERAERHKVEDKLRRREEPRP